MKKANSNALKPCKSVETLEMTVEIPTIVFNHLMTNAVCDCNDLNGTIGFSSEHETFGLSFFSESISDFETLIAEDFGFFTGDDWTIATPTTQQLAEMQQKITAKADQLQTEKLEELERETEATEYHADPYSFNGVSQSNFI